MIREYRKKPLIIEALQWTGENLSEVYAFCPILQSEFPHYDDIIPELYIRTLEGEMHISRMDYIIKGIRGEFYACKPDIFWETYDLF